MIRNTISRLWGRHSSLRVSLVLLIFGCWVLPMLTTLVISSMHTLNNTRQRVADIVTASVENTMALAQRDLDNVVTDALSLSYTPTIRNAYQNYQQGGSPAALLTQTRTFLNTSFYRSRTARAAYVVFPEMQGANSVYWYADNAMSYREMMDFYSSSLYTQMPELMEDLGSDVRFWEEDGRLYLVRQLTLLDKNFVPYAFVAVEVNQSNLYMGMDNLPWLTDITLWLDGCTIPVLGEVAKTPVPPGTLKSWFEMENYQLVMYDELAGERYALRYRITADMKPLTEELGQSRNTVLWAVLLSTMLMALVLVFIWRRVNRPVATLSRFARLIEHGEFGAQIDAGRLGSKEFVYLGGQMNAMSARLEDQFERLYREELALRDAKIKALQSQINPHFLGNTLEIINWEARLAGNAKVSQMLEALSTMIEAALDRRRRPLIHLSEEMHYVNAYLFIISERLGKRLVVDKEIDESLLDAYVPRLILQPIVENAIEHGVSGQQHGHVTIRACRQDAAWMRLEVENNSPMSRQDEERVHRLLEGDDLQDNESSGNIGIYNVHQRLRILYGPQGGLTVENTKKGNTLSSMCIGLEQKRQIEST